MFFLSSETGTSGLTTPLLTIVPDVAAPCDFDGDGDCDDADADLLTGAGNLVTGVGVPPADSKFDLTNDTIVNSDDLTQWRTNTGAARGFPEPVRRGDTNVDGDVDTDDLTRAIIGYNGAAGSGNVWSDGDTDGDGDTDTTDLTTAIINFTGLEAAAGDGDALLDPNVPDVFYNHETGEVWIDTDGQDVISFVLLGGPFNTQHLDLSGLPAGLSDNLPNQIGWTSYNIGGGLTGTANLGAILPPGLSQREFCYMYVPTANYGLSVVQPGGGPMDRIPCIPEPSSLALLGISVLALVRRRDKTNRSHGE